MDSLSVFIERNSKSKISQFRIFIWNNQSKDFVSILNESWSNTLDKHSLNNKVVEAVAVEVGKILFVLFRKSYRNVKNLESDITIIIFGVL